MRRFFGILTFVLALPACRSLPPGPSGEERRQAPRKASLLAGAARLDLVPPWFVSLAGYGKRMGRAFEGVHDRPGVRALYLIEEGATAGTRGVAVISADLLLVPDELRRLVEEKLAPLELSGFVLAATHNHSGPGNYFPNLLAEAIAMGGFRRPMLSFLAERIAEAVVEARRGAQPARLGAAAGEAPGLSRHRRDPQGEVDASLALVRVEALEGRPIAHLVSFAAHPTVLGPENLLLSADFPGFLCRAIEKRSGAVALFLNGACAEIAPSPPVEGGSFAAGRALGEALAQRAFSLDGEIRAERTVALGFASRMFRLPPRGVLASLAVPAETRLQVLTLGPVHLATFPCDFGVRLGLDLKRAAPGIAVPVSYADGYIGYAVDEETYSRGWYETRMSFYGPGLGRFLVESSLSLFPVTK